VRHPAVGRGGGIELHGHAADSNAAFLEFGDGIQNRAGVAAEAVKLVNEKLIGLARQAATRICWPSRRCSSGNQPGATAQSSEVILTLEFVTSAH
jgi:hypothetical protein